MASAEGFDDMVGKLISKGAKIDAVTSVRIDVARVSARLRTENRS